MYKRQRLGKDIEEAELGNKEGPLKAALDVFRDIRNELRESVQYGRISGESYRDHLQNYYTPMNTFLSIGRSTFASGKGIKGVSRGGGG